MNQERWIRNVYDNVGCNSKWVNNCYTTVKRCGFERKLMYRSSRLIRVRKILEGDDCFQ